MTRSLKLAFSLVLAAGAIIPALAQDNFPDAPANHWAYEALGKMKAEGLLVGYPDGLYRGPRPASRYEMACAMHAVYTNLKNLIDGMQTQLDALKGINPQDIQNLKDQVANLQNEVNAMKGWGDDIAALKRASEEFDKELKSLGVDVDAMKKDLGDLAERVTRLEKRKPVVNIAGDVNFWAGSTQGSGSHFGLSQDGRVIGHSGSVPISLLNDLTMLHEGAFTLSGTNETGPQWKGTFVVGNMLGETAFGNQSSLWRGYNEPTGGPYSFAEGKEDAYIQDLEVKFGTSLGGLALDATAGRVGYKLSPYVFQRVDPFSYYQNERWDNGEYHLDGAILGFNFGSVKLHVWGGNNSNEDSVDGIDINPTIISNNRVAGGGILGEGSEGIGGTYGKPITAAEQILGQIDHTAAVDASFGLGGNGHVNLSYLILEQANGAGLNNLVGDGLANRDNVFGGDADFMFGKLKLSGGYHLADLTVNSSGANSHDNAEWNAQLGYSADRLNVWGGYREVDQHYYAPGDWGRLGILVNPANIKGWQAGAHFDLTHSVRITASGEWDKGNKTETPGGGYFYGSPFNTDSNMSDYMARLDLKVNPSLSVFGSYDYARFSSLDATVVGSLSGTPQYGWTTFGFGYGISANAKLNVQYQLSNVGNDFLLGSVNGAPTGRYVGGFLSSQLSLKF